MNRHLTHPPAVRPGRTPFRAEAWASGRPAGLVSIRILVFGISSLTFGIFNPDIFGAPGTVVEMVQKVIGVALWALLIAVTFLPGVTRRPPASTGLMLPVLLLGWVLLSVVWSNEPGNTPRRR